ncbi:hypothetical protein Val02_04210 [Virgisporangium aliadipatigenens]|uniref:Uncharacterized protein n=1 Tax=Virgisporangium aliadipatigenens TaxID=741659 RepID=A0A8J3YGB1_9ACTN|nr:hypothetical protein [Virgisporangium aliadipatigenens]GIJ43535.1 hypothetical protein Val02_04210 [Virgisporangium aliadipatigenens]
MSFDGAFTRVGRSAWLRGRFGAILDTALPPEVEPFSFVPLTGLREFAAALRLRSGETLVDLACPPGSPPSRCVSGRPGTPASGTRTRRAPTCRRPTGCAGSWLWHGSQFLPTRGG